jgi:hypothetical protein
MRPQLMSLIIHPYFKLHLLHSCLCSWLRLQGLAFLARSIRVTRIDNQWSNGVVTARVQSSVWSIRHQRRDFHQSTYLYLLEDRDSTSHHFSSMFSVSMPFAKESWTAWIIPARPVEGSNKYFSTWILGSPGRPFSFQQS